MISTRVLSASKINWSRFAAATSFSTNRNTPVREMHRKSIYKTEEAKKIRFYVIHKYVEYLKNYDKLLEKRFPGAMQVYRVFMDGTKDFLRDVKDYFRIVRILNSNDNSFLKLTRKDIELYHQVPKDMLKVAPVLIMSTLPLANYVIFPLIYWFPKQLVSSHFWTLQQKSEFKIVYLRDRLLHNKPIFRYLQLQLDFLKSHRLYDSWATVLGMLGSGVQPSVEQILECKELFMSEPYHLLYLSRNHVKQLLKMHETHMGWFRRTRLADRASILIEMDKAIIREGGVHNLPLDALRNACYIRGLNPTNMKTDDMVEWLKNWIQVSNQIDKHTVSLLLHCPVLLGYNEPSNWRLIYPKKS